MKTPSSMPLKPLVQTLNDGVEFYRAAIAKAEHDDFKEVFAELLDCRQFALAYLQPYVVLETGSQEDGHTFGGKLHHAYTAVQDNCNTDHDLTLLKQLEFVEDETLKAMKLALTQSGNAMVQTVIRHLTPRMQTCRDRLTLLEKSIAA